MILLSISQIWIFALVCFVHAGSYRKIYFEGAFQRPNNSQQPELTGREDIKNDTSPSPVVNQTDVVQKPVVPGKESEMKPQDNYVPKIPVQPPSEKTPPNIEIPPSNEHTLYSNQHEPTIIGSGLLRLSLEMTKIFNGAKENIVFSPLSIATAMAVALLGAAGDTASEIADFLSNAPKSNLNQRPHQIHNEMSELFDKLEAESGIHAGTELSLAVGMFFQRNMNLSQLFVNDVINIYRCEVYKVDFMKKPIQARKSINDWVSDRTKGRIKNIMSHDLSPDTKAILANALYFNGQWETPFPPAKKHLPFHLAPNNTVNVLVMINSGEVYYHEQSDCTVLGLPYVGGDLVMYMIRPNSDLQDYLEKLTIKEVNHLVNSSYKQQVVYIVPKLKLESVLDLRSPLEKLGVKQMFSPGHANFKGIGEGIYADDIVHKVEIDINETGTIASAATLTTLVRSAPIVRLNKPFAYFIHHRPTNSVVFWGTVVNPTSAKSH